MDRYASVAGLRGGEGAHLRRLRGGGRQRRRRAGARHAARRDRRVLSLQPAFAATRTTRSRTTPSSWCSGAASRCCRFPRLRIQGRHNAANAMAALAMCEALELPDAPGARRARGFRRAAAPRAVGRRYRRRALRERLEGHERRRDLAAIDGMSAPLVLIAGGDGKNADFAPLARGLPRQGASRRADRPRRAAHRRRRGEIGSGPFIRRQTGSRPISRHGVRGGHGLRRPRRARRGKAR